jgi:glycerol-3-phosphate dehydrogenase (NAD(P)+)
MNELSIIGAGAWGTALASVLSGNGTKTIIFGRELEAIESINKLNENKQFLPSIKLPKALSATNEIDVALKSKIILLTTPSQYFRSQLRQISKHNFAPDAKFVICTKGIENDSLELMSEIFEQSLDNNYAIFSGPTFASEVANNTHTNISLAAKDIALANDLKEKLTRKTLKIKTNNDIIGSQVCGAVKNVIAIACGIVKGLGHGENTKAAIINIGFHEIMLLNLKLGGKSETMLEPCGLGDLVLTCGSEKSRNFSYGISLAQGNISSYLEGKLSIAEGVATSKSVVQLSKKLGLDLPLCNIIYNIIFHQTPADEILNLV